MATASFLGITSGRSASQDLDALRRYASSGDPEAFAFLAGRYQAMVLATCRRTLGNSADAEDAAQETFLKLARAAGSVRSNVGAWLHAAAVRTSIDLLRRVDAARRAERRASAERDLEDADPNAALWRDIEPLLDDALARLDPADRELIIGRFLVGRSQAEMAREAGVPDGTVHRRTQKALGKLRKHFGAAAPVTIGALTAALAMAPTDAGSAAFGAALSKIGLAGVVSGSAGVTKVAALAIAAACVLGGGAVVVGALSLPGPAGTAPPPGAHAASVVADWDLDSGKAPKRPRKDWGGHRMVSAVYSSLDRGGAWITEDTISVAVGSDGKDESWRLDFKILSTDVSAQPPVMKLRVERASLPAEAGNDLVPGVEVSASVERDMAGRLKILPLDDGVRFGLWDEAWYGVRPPAGWPESDQVPDDAGPIGVLGPWAQSAGWTGTIERDHIMFGEGEWAPATYRIIDWTESGSVAKVNIICDGGWYRKRIGDRHKAIVRRGDDGYQVAWFSTESGMSDQWPTSFEYSDEHPVQVFTFLGTDRK